MSPDAISDTASSGAVKSTATDGPGATSSRTSEARPISTQRKSPLDPRRRTFWRSLHLWLGLVIGLFWAIQGLTGALLVFHREMDRIGAPVLSDGRMLPPSRLIADAAAATGRPIQRLTRVGADPRLVEARYNDAANAPQAIQLDAATGRVVGHRERDPATPFAGSAWRWIYLVHLSMLAGVAGRLAIGISGIVLLLALGAGLGLAWPRRRQWRASFAVRKWRTVPQRLWGWHRAIGLAAAVPLIVMAVTGSYQAFGTRITPILTRFTNFQPMAASAHQMGRGESHDGAHAAIDPDEALSVAKRKFPDGVFMNLELPVEHPDYYLVRFTLPQEWRRWSGRATVKIDPHSGSVVATYDPVSAARINRIDDAVYPVHMGEAGGLVGRLAVAALGLAMPVFYVTGVWLWWRKRRPAQKPKPVA